MAHIHARSKFSIDADEFQISGRNTDPDAEIDFTTQGNKKIRFNQPLDIDGSKGAFIQGKKGQQLIKDETGNAIMEVKSDGNLKLLTSVDFNNQAPVNFSGGGGGGATTTSGISSENLVGQTLEDELDALTTQQTSNTGAIATNTGNIATNTGNIATNTTNIATNTTNIASNTTDIATNTTDIATNTTDIATNTGNIATNTTNITNLTSQQTTNTNAIATNGLAITNLTNQQTTNTNNIASLTTTQGTQGTNITALQTQQALNISAIASNTARTSNLTANRLLISSATGTINTGNIGETDVATKNSSNIFTAPLGNPATQNSFDTITASTITNTGTTESASYTQGGAALNFSHLSGTLDKADLPTEAVRTDLADQTINSSGALTKITIDNTHATGNANLVLQKRSTAGVLERGFTIQQTSTGTNITGQAPAGQQPDILITPANGSLAMSIGGLESRFHNNLKILGSMSGAARNDQKDYIFKTIGSNGTGDTLLLEDVLLRPTQGSPPVGFNPPSTSLIQLNTSGIPSYKAVTDFLTLPSGLPTNPSAVLIDSAGTTSYLESSVVLTKPAGNNPSVRSFVAVETGGSFSYVPSSFLPLPSGLLPTSGENIIFVNPGGPSAYVDRANLIERPGAANPSSGTALITIDNTGSRAYKNINQFLTTIGGANPSSDSFIKISSTGVQSYVAESSLGGGGIQKPGNANPSADSLISLDPQGVETYLPKSQLIKTTTASQTITKSTGSVSFEINCNSATQGDEASFKISRTNGGDNDIEFIPRRGTFTEWRCKNDLKIYINGQEKVGVGNHTVTFSKPLVMLPSIDLRLQTSFTAPANSSSTGTAGTIGFDSNHLYIAVGTNSWKRVALSTF